MKLQEEGEGERCCSSVVLYGAISAVSVWKTSTMILSGFHSRTMKLLISPSEVELGGGDPAGFVSAQFGGHADGLTPCALKKCTPNLCGVLQIIKS